MFADVSAAQDMMRHIDLSSPDMVSTEMTRADVEGILAAASAARPADFSGKRLSRLDLSGVDLSGAVFVQRTGIISSHAILGGLHHHYVRA